MDISQEFDSISAGYTEKISRWVPYYKEMVGSIAARLPEGFSAGDILDFGAGNGNVTALLLNRFPYARFTLLDASPDMIGECRCRFEQFPHFQYSQAYFQEADFPNRSFDLIAAGLSLHHLAASEKPPVFKKIYDWLRPGGCLSYSDLFVDRNEEPGHSQVIADWKRDAFNLGTTHEEWDWIMDHYGKYDHPDSFDQQIQWLNNAGFQDVLITWSLNSWGNVLARKRNGGIVGSGQ
jgi:tRNA (cmo5U34)-methyltransferase